MILAILSFSILQFKGNIHSANRVSFHSKVRPGPAEMLCRETSIPIQPLIHRIGDVGVAERLEDGQARRVVENMVQVDSFRAAGVLCARIGIGK